MGVSVFLALLALLDRAESCSFWCNSWTCGFEHCESCGASSGCEAGNTAPQCAEWCNRWTCGFEHCSACQQCIDHAAGLSCASWCNRWTCSSQFVGPGGHCGGCAACLPLHDRELQWREVHGYWQGQCVELDEHGDPGTPYTRFAVVDTLQDQYRERLIYSTASWWITDVVGTIVPSPTSRTTVEQSVVVGGGRSSSSGSSTRSRTQAVGNDNALQTSFYTSDGVLTHSRLISFRSDAGGKPGSTTPSTTHILSNILDTLG